MSRAAKGAWCALALCIALLPASPALALAATVLQASRCGLVVADHSGSTVSVRYVGLPANQPVSYANFIALWPSSVVPWTVPPTVRQALVSNTETGSQVLSQVSIGALAYTLAYAVGPKVADTCASALIGADGSTGVIDAVTLELVDVGASTLTFRYHTLSGYRPAQAGNWIGLWRGRVSPYNAPAYLAKSLIASDVTDDVIAFNDVTLQPGSIYTAVYFMDESSTSAAALLTFRVASGG